MEWWLIMVLIFGSLIVLMLTGLPVAFCFVAINMVGVFLIWNGIPGLYQFILSIRDSLSSFILLPVPLFILMGELMFHSGIALDMIDAIDKWMGRLPGRLGLVSVAAGTLFSTLTGASMASVAMLGSTLVPEMEKRGYQKPMSLGPILGSGGLAMMIPPSVPAVVLGSLSNISIGKLLIAIIFPGVLMAILYATYIIGRCRLQPSLAPAYKVPPSSLFDKLVATLRYVLPVGLIVFLVIGVIFLGIATPSEAGATGTLGMFILVAAYRKLSWQMLKKSFGGALQITVMVLLILAGAKAFSQILGFSGAGRGLAEFALGLPLSPIWVIVAMQVVAMVLGMFMGSMAIMMITIPIFMPVVQTLGFNPLWFGALYLVSLEMAQTSPPYGLSLFIMKGVAPPGTTMGDCYRAALPFLYCDLIALALIMAFPAIALWMPGVMR